MGEVPSGTPTPDAPAPAGEAGPIVDAAIVDGPPGMSGPAASFTATVTPIVTKAANHCLDSGCHAGTFPPNLSSYDTLDAKYKKKPGASNPLTTKPAPHAAVLSTSDKAAIAAWIDSLP